VTRHEMGANRLNPNETKHYAPIAELLTHVAPPVIPAHAGMGMTRSSTRLSRAGGNPVTETLGTQHFRDVGGEHGGRFASRKQHPT